MEETTPEEQTTIFESSDIVAFLITQEKPTKPFLREPDKRVCFAFTGDISKEIEAFYSNVPVRILDYTKNLKLVRSMIFSLKAGGAR